MLIINLTSCKIFCKHQIILLIGRISFSYTTTRPTTSKANLSLLFCWTILLIACTVPFANLTLQYTWNKIYLKSPAREIMLTILGLGLFFSICQDITFHLNFS